MENKITIATRAKGLAEAIRYDAGFAMCEAGSTSRTRYAFEWLRSFAGIVWISVILAGYCRLRGHDTEGVASAESGKECIWCKRCGWSLEARF